MISIDTNILLYSLNPTSNGHLAAQAFLRERLGAKAPTLALADFVLVELYVLLRNPAVMARPLSALEARDIATRYLRFPNVMRVESAPVMDAVWTHAGRVDFGRRKIFDTRLALTLRHHGVTHFATANVRDFADFGFEQVWNPLLTSST